MFSFGPCNLVHLACDPVEQSPAVIALNVDIEMGAIRQKCKMWIAAQAI